MRRKSSSGRSGFPVVQSCGAVPVRPGHGLTALVLLPGNRESVHRRHPDRAGLRHGVLGPGDEHPTQNPLIPVNIATLKQGEEAIEKAKAASAQTPRERDWIAALDTYYRDLDTVDHQTRVLAYEKAMEELSLRYPDDSEATIFYALALNEATELSDKTYARQLKAGAMLKQVFAQQPDHPGVAHYIIHSYDYEPLVARALPAARHYAAIAPSAPHALHMPSHIFSVLGLWSRYVITSDTAAEAVLQGVRGEAPPRPDHLAPPAGFPDPRAPAARARPGGQAHR